MSQPFSVIRDHREKMLQEKHRPRYHLVASEGVHSPFDPNAAIYWKGRYHLMYIVQTEKGHCWAHVSSKDLLHWRHHPMALEPGGVDEGIFSGGIFLDQDGTPTITYWGLGKDAGICLATSTDDNLDYWTKSPRNPVVHQTQFGYSVTPNGEPYGVADPSAIWFSEGRYYMLTGNLLVLRKYGLEQGIDEHKGDTVYLLRSDNLTDWEYLHRFYTSRREWTQDDEDNMCPDFFPLGNRHMLLFISHNRGCQYYIGRLEGDHFHPETHGRMTWVDHTFFAPESLLDEQGRRIMWAWLHDGVGEETRKQLLWSGTMSLPRVLWLGEDKTLRMSVPDEFESLRYRPRLKTGLSVGKDADVFLWNLEENSYEIFLEIDSDDARQFGIKVACSPDGEEQTAIFYDQAEKQLKVDTTKSGLNDGPKVVESAPFELRGGESLKLRVFVDRSVVEVFANDRQAIARRIYPTRDDSVGVSVMSRGGPSRVIVVKSWDMAPTNPW